MAEEFTPIETQEAFETVIAERLEAARVEERGKFSDYEEIKGQLATANETNAKLSSENAKLKIDAMKRRVADETGLPIALAKRLTGDDEAAMRADAEDLLKSIKPKVKTPPMRNPDAKPSADDAFKRLLAGLKND